MTSTTDADAEVTVVVVSWDRRDLALRCLASLEAQTGTGDTRIALHVVDNASQDGTAEAIRDEYPQVVVQRLTTNTGFAGGVAAALEVVRSPWVVLVNNDAVPQPDFLSRLLAARAGADDTAAWTARVLLADPVEGIELVNSTGVVVRRDGNGADRGWLAPAATTHPPPEVFAFCGAAVLLRAEAVRAVGGFDPWYFLYYEDTDLSWRLRLAGWQVRYVDDAVVRHEHGASSSIGSPLFRFYNERNRLVTLVRNAPLPLVLPVVARHPVASLARLLRGGETAAVGRVRLRAYGAFLRHLPAVLRARRETPSDLRARRAAVARLLGG